MIKPDGLLMIEPLNKGSENPIIDDYTCLATYALRLQIMGQAYRGFHVCKCGAHSDNRDRTYNGIETNSLIVHYVAMHRDEVPQAELDKLLQVPGKLYPTPKEIYGKMSRFNI